MTALAETSLSVDERALIERFAHELHVRLDGGVHAIWLFGSRARGAIRSFFIAEVDRDKVDLGALFE